MEVSMSITRRGKYTDSNICMNVQVCDVACLFFLLYANLLVLVTLCEGNHYPFIEEDNAFLLKHGKIRFKKQKSHLFFFKQSFLFSSFLKVSVTYQHSKNSGQNHIVFLFVCLFVCMFTSSKSEICYPMR